MQFVPGGSIASILARFGALDESVFRRYTKQILEGVQYLHDNDIIHRYELERFFFKPSVYFIKHDSAFAFKHV